PFLVGPGTGGMRQERPFPKQATNASIRTEADIRALRNSGKTQRSESLGKHDEDEHFDLAAQIANWAVCSGQDVQLFCLGSEEHSQLLQESRECGLVFQDQVIAARQRDEPGSRDACGEPPAEVERN